MPDIIKKQAISSLKPDNTVIEAATMMTSANVAAIIILDNDGKLVGIVTERDLTRRAIAKGLEPKETLLSDIMTANPDTLAPDDSAGDALELMQSRHYRHLPVVDGGICV
ncbi:MAG: CBS domain-containing protein, partial [Alphaproteobacteria bacterium]|nr:CBS domain-containing protein [Alphaproteobacteria bacterium]